MLSDLASCFLWLCQSPSCGTTYARHRRDSATPSQDVPIHDRVRGHPRTMVSGGGQRRPTPSMLAVRERAGGAVLRCVQDGDGGRSGALFGARADALNGRRQQGVRDVKTAKSASSSVRRTGQRRPLLQVALVLACREGGAGEERSESAPSLYHRPSTTH